MLKNLKITKKLPLIMILFSLITALVIGVIAYKSAATELEMAAKDKLSSLLDSRRASLENYFDTIQQDLSFHAQSPLVIRSLKAFKNAWTKLPENKTAFLQNLYIDQNPYSVAQKDAFLVSSDGSEYSELHGIYHPAFRNLVTLRSYYDLFLFDREGNLVYSVIKERDFATNMINGQWRNTDLAKVFNTINKNPIAGKHIFTDFSAYEPSNNDPASFIGSPVYDEHKNYIGALVFQMPIDRLNNVMQVTAGMGESGETYLVGSDLLMRSDSRFYAGRSILVTKVDTSSVHSALKGESDVHVVQDYRGISVFSAYGPIDFLGVRWAVIAEIDEAETLKPVYKMGSFLFMSSLISAMVICFIGYFLALDIAQPIVAMTNMMDKLARNELDTNISVAERQDEVGGMAKALVVFKENAIEKIKLQKKLNYMTEHDTLTGSNSRLFAMDYLDALFKESKARHKSLAVMFLDLDNFKAVNDLMGHETGDRLLKEVAARLSECVRDTDVVSRMGGDEFLIILPDISDEADVNVVADKVMKIMGTAFVSLEGKCKVTGSIGIAIYPKHAESALSLIKQADRAMYLAKEKGKNSYCYPISLPLGPLLS